MSSEAENSAPAVNVFAFANSGGASKPAGIVKDSSIARPTSATPKKTAPVTAPKSTGKVQKDRVISTPSTPGSIIASDSREAAKAAKLQCERERLHKVALLKEKWAKEKEQKTQFYQEKRELALRTLQERTQISAEQRRKNLEKQKELEDKDKQQRKEQLSASLGSRAQLAKDLQEESKARRRISVFLNAQMRKKAQEREAAIQHAQREEQESLSASRRLDMMQLREAKKEEDERRRESFANRGIAAQEQKKVAEELAQKKREDELALLELRKQNWEDVVQLKASEEQQRRESVSGRIEEWRKQRAVGEKQQQEKNESDLQLLLTRKAEHQDVQVYKQEQERRRRESLAFRLDKWREEKSLDQRNKEQDELAHGIENELNTLAREDVEVYRQKQKESKRQSLSYRLDKARKDRDFEAGQKALKQLVMEEEQRLQDLDRQDVQAYRQRIVDARRQSLEYRNQVEFRDRMRQEGERQAQKAAESADRELREEAWKDVRKFREQEREAQRKSLAWRLADAQRKHEIDLSQHEEQLNRMHLDLQCRREDWLALQEHKKEEAERRRRSVSLRLESWRSQRLAEAREREKKEMIAEEDAILREMDREELFAAKLAQDMMDRRNLMGTELNL